MAAPIKLWPNLCQVRALSFSFSEELGVDEFSNNFFSILAGEKHFSVIAAVKIKAWDDEFLLIRGAAASGPSRSLWLLLLSPVQSLNPIIAKLRSCQINTVHTPKPARTQVPHQNYQFRTSTGMDLGYTHDTRRIQLMPPSKPWHS